MDSTASTASNRAYEDFDPSTKWKREALADTLIVYLPCLLSFFIFLLVLSQVRRRFRKSKKTREEPRYKSSTKLKKIANKSSSEPKAPKLQKTTEQIKQNTAEPSKPLQEPSKPEKPSKEEPSKLLQAPKWEKRPQETPKPAKEEPSKLEKPRTEKEEKEQVVRTRKVTSKAATSDEQGNAGKMEKAEALPEINESGSSRFAMESYMNSISGLMKEMKNARNATNMVLAILFGVVLALYGKNAVRSFMKSED